MAKIEHKDKAFKKPEPITFSNEELKKFELELEKYKIDIPTYKGNNGKVYFGNTGMHKWLKDNGALSRNSTPESYVILSIPTYEMLMEKLDQLNKYLSRRDYAVKQDRIATDKLVDGMTLNTIPDDSYID